MTESDATDGSPLVELSTTAIERLKGLIETVPGPAVAGIRLQILRRVPEGFEHQLTIVDAGQEPEDDDELDVDGVRFFVEDRNAAYLDGVKIHYEFKGDGVNGFEFDNPNPIWHDPVELRVQELFDSSINPSIASHGGYVDLIGIEGKTAYVQLGGGCQGCGMADVTLKQGIDVAVKETAPEIEQVVDVTDHASGTNPYYQPSKK